MGLFKLLILAMIMSRAAIFAMAERIYVSSDAVVADSVKRLINAVEGAGAMLFVTVDFALGAQSVGEILRPTNLVIFGSPKIGSTALHLPFRILFYEDIHDQTWAIYNDPITIALSHGVAPDDTSVLGMCAAFESCVAAATSK